MQSRPLPEKDKAKDAKETEPTFDITVRTITSSRTQCVVRPVCQPLCSPSFQVIHDGSITNDTLGHVQLPWSAAQKAKGTGPQWYQLKREKNGALNAPFVR